MRPTSSAILALLATSCLAAPANPPATTRNLSVDPPSSSSLFAYDNKVLLFRHGEKKSDSSIGLSLKGKKRAKCLRSLLGRDSKHNVGLILAEKYNKDTGKRRRPYETVKGLAHDLGLEVDVSCEVDDVDCVARKIEKYAKSGGKGEVVICWKHSMLHKIARALGADDTSPYPDDRYDIIWTLTHRRIVKKEPERCPGLDPQKERKNDPDLEVDGETDELEEYLADLAVADRAQVRLGGLDELD
ncbi:hypothetical protein JCM10296v2_006690 [Rhodotorula toruloides]